MNAREENAVQFKRDIRDMDLMVAFISQALYLGLEYTSEQTEDGWIITINHKRVQP